MSKVKLQVDKQQLINTINEVEKNGPLLNRSELAETVAQTDWAKNYKPKPVTKSVVILRIKEFGIEPKTLKGKGQNNISRVATQKRKKRQKINLQELRDATPKKYWKLIDQIESGSNVACIKLKCLECSGWQTKEIRLCPVKTCANHSRRPYQ